MTENIVDINDDRIDECIDDISSLLEGDEASIEEVLYVTKRIDELMAPALYAAFEYGNKYEQMEVLTYMIRLMMVMSVTFGDMLEKNDLQSFAWVYGSIGTQLDDTRIRIMGEIVEKFVSEHCNGTSEGWEYNGFVGDSLGDIAIDENAIGPAIMPNQHLNLLADAIMHELGNEPLFNGSDSPDQWYEYSIDIGGCYIPSIGFFVDGNGHGYASDDSEEMHYIPIGYRSWKTVVNMAMDWTEKEEEKSK